MADGPAYFRDEDAVVRERMTGSPERWSAERHAWIPYPRFDWAMAHPLTEDQARALAPEAFAAAPYWSLAPLRYVYLEDSYVLEILVHRDEVRFELDAVLRPEHPAYDDPRADEHYCYRRATLRFDGVRRVDWRPGTTRPAVDADGEVDYGNIDTFLVSARSFELEGDWGSMHLESEPPALILHSAASDRSAVHPRRSLL